MKNSGVRRLIADLDLGYALGNAVDRICEKPPAPADEIVSLEEAKNFIDIQLNMLRREVKRAKDNA